MYERGIWRAEEAIDLYRRDAEERLAVPGLFWYRAAGTLILMALGALLAVGMGGLWINVFDWGWHLVAVGGFAGLVGAIILWRIDDE